VTWTDKRRDTERRHADPAHSARTLAGKIDARAVAILNRRTVAPSGFLSASIEPAKWYPFARRAAASAGPAAPFNLISEAPFPSIIDTRSRGGESN